MKKRGIKKIDGNVILFPEVEKKLLEKGLESLQNKHYLQAIELFEEAIKYDPENHDINVGLVLAYYEAGSLQEAKAIASEMLRKGLGDYFQTVDLYLMILVQLHEYEEIITTIEVLFDEKEIPPDLLEHFSKMLVFSRRMVDDKNNQNESFDERLERPLSNDFLKNPDSNKLLLDIAELSSKNVRVYIEPICTYLQDKEGHPFLKTMLLNILMEQEYESSVVVEKFGREMAIKPVSLSPVDVNTQKDSIQLELQDHLESEDPILYQQILSLLDRHFFLLYPFELVPDHSSIWAAAFHYIGLEYNGMAQSLEKLTENYGVYPREVEKAYSYIKELEEISYPII